MTATPSPQFINSLNAALTFWKGQEERGVISNLDRERQNLHRAVKMGLVLPETRVPAIEVALGAFNLVYMRGYWWEWLPILELSIESCPENQLRLKADLLNRYGDLLRFSGHPAAAIIAHKEALNMAFHLDDPLRLGEAHARLGHAYREAGQFEEAEHHCHLALNELEKCGEAGLSLTANVMAALGKMALRQGKPVPAKEYMGQAVTIWRQLSDRLRLAQGLNDLGMVHQDSNEPDDALQYYNEAMQLLDGTEHKLDYLLIQYSTSVLLFSQQLWPEAEAAFRGIDLEYLRQTDNIFYEARVITALGNTVLYQQRAEEAFPLLCRAESLWKKLDDKEELANAVGSLGEALAALGKRDAAEKQFMEALEQLALLPDYPRVIRLRSLFAAELQKLAVEQA